MMIRLLVLGLSSLRTIFGSDVPPMYPSKEPSMVPSEIPSGFNSETPSGLNSGIPSSLNSEIPSRLNSEVPSAVDSPPAKPEPPVYKYVYNVEDKQAYFRQYLYSSAYCEDIKSIYVVYAYEDSLTRK